MKNVTDSIPVRMAAFAQITAIEIDFRGIVMEQIISKTDDVKVFFELYAKLLSRYNQNNAPIDSITAVQSTELLDFQDSYTVILKNAEYVDDEIIKEIRLISPLLDELCPIRNKVMHSRPFEYDEYLKLLTFSQTQISKPHSVLKWSRLREAMEQIANGSDALFKLQVPEASENYGIPNNLPSIDFEETGFIGRKSEQEEILEAIRGKNPVITVIGAGGLGKTALVQKIAYDIVDSDAYDFDYVVWVDAKQTILSGEGVRTIKNIISSGALITEIRGEVAGKAALDGDIDEIISVAKEYELLVIIDNLETILDEQIMSFIRRLSNYAKILITSRIGLGDIEYKIQLKEFGDKDSRNLIRLYSRIKKVDDLVRIPDKEIDSIIKRLYNNPLGIKWFVGAVATGQSPDYVLSQKVQLLDFCLSNVYNHLSEIEQEAIVAILSYRKEITEAELAYLLSIPPIDAKKILYKLWSTSFITRRISRQNHCSYNVYSLTDFSKDYFSKSQPPSRAKYEHYLFVARKLEGALQNMQVGIETNIFDANSIAIETPPERISAKVLVDALKAFRNKTLPNDAILEKISRAKEMTPGYSEVYRVSAFIRSKLDDIMGAEEDYATGLEISQSNTKLLYFYINHLISEIKDIPKATKHAESLIRLIPDDVDAKMLYSRCVAYSGDLNKAIDMLIPISRNYNASPRHRNYASVLIMEFARRMLENTPSSPKIRETHFKYFKIGVEAYCEREAENEADTRSLDALDKMLCEAFYFFENNLIREEQDQIFKLISTIELDTPTISKYLKAKQSAPKNEGRIERFNGTYGFLLGNDTQRLYFSAHSLSAADRRDGYLVGQRVNYEIGENSTGPTAINIHVIRR